MSRNETETQAYALSSRLRAGSESPQKDWSPGMEGTPGFLKGG